MNDPIIGKTPDGNLIKIDNEAGTISPATTHDEYAQAIGAGCTLDYEAWLSEMAERASVTAARYSTALRALKGQQQAEAHFDLTPRGAMTAEGRKRITTAQDGLHDALARCAEALREMTDAMEDKEGGIAPFLMKGGMASEDAHDLSRDALKGLRLWKDAGETFVRAVAGAPERRKS
jgi:hypothetical protein